MTQSIPERVATTLRYYQENRRAEAQAIVTKILAEAPDQPHALFLLGLILADGPDLDAAERAFLRSVTLLPENAPALHHLGKLSRRRGDDAAAIAWFQRALAVAPELSASANDLGLSLRHLGRFDAALAAFDRAVTIDPADAVAHSNRGLLLLDRGRAAEAVTAFRHVLGLRPHAADAARNLAIALDTLGDSAAAEAAFRQALTVDPADSLALHHLGKLSQRCGDDDAATGYFERALAVRPDFAPAANDLGVSLLRLRRRDEALAAFDRALAIDPADAVARRNRGRLLLDLGRAGEAVAEFRQVLTLTPQAAEVWLNLATALDQDGDPGAACAAGGQATALAPDNLEAWLRLAHFLDRTHRDEEAQSARNEWARRQGPVFTPCTGTVPQARVLLIAGAGDCNVPTRYLFGSDRFETIALYLLPWASPEGAAPTVLAQLPEFDIAFNAVGDADLGVPFLSEAERICRSLTCPVLNPPPLIPPTRRDRAAALFHDVAGLVLPATRRLGRAALQALAAGGPLERPVLLRPAGSHGGLGLTRADTTAELTAWLETMPAEEHYVSDFHDFRSEDGHYRKYRLIFVDREVYAYHLAIGETWLVHYWRADMAKSPWKLAEEAAFLEDYRNVFTGSSGDTIRELAHRLDLDYGGIDCTLLRDGRILLFEANATMLVHLGDSADEPVFKYRAAPRIADAISRLVAHRLAGR